MLVLSRNFGESLLIGKDIRVKILRMQNGEIHVGIEAPKNIKILRQELCKQKKTKDDD